MIFYYIDDSMLARNEFATAVLHRFECWMEHHPADLVLVSTAQKNHPQLEHFVDAMKRTTVLASPAQFEFQGVRGDLRNGFLCVEGFPEIDKIVFNIMFLFSISVKLRGDKGNKKKWNSSVMRTVNFVGEVS